MPPIEDRARAAPRRPSEAGARSRPPQPTAAPVPTAPSDPASADLFDWALLRGYARVVRGAPLRHRALALGAFTACVLAAVLAVKTLPRTYHTQTTVLAQRNQVMAALGNPGRAVPGDADAPTRNVAETVLRRDNLVALVKQTDLVSSWDRTRAPLSRAKDAIVRRVRGAPDDDEKLDALVYVLERRLKVTTDERTVTIAIDWPDAGKAYEIVETAQQNFFETRHALEVSTIAEAISILEGHAANVRDRIETSLEDVRRAKVERSPGPVRARVVAAPARPRQDPRVAQLKLMLVAKRRAISELEDFRQRRVAELMGQLAEQKATYAAAHPLVLATQQSIDALSRESPQLAALHREEAELVSAYVASGGDAADAERHAPPPTVAAPTEPLAAIAAEAHAAARSDAPREEEEISAHVARSQLNFAVAKYEELLGRIDAARIELDTARAAFKYRYSVVRPAEPPKAPTRPNVPLTLVGGVLAGVLLAYALSTWVDLRRGTAVEAWQLERELGLPVVGEVEDA
jgi:uncharacterized protein involved in exopolysaccharide biosynthesis